MLAYRCAPVRPRDPRAWRNCPVRPAARAEAGPAPGSPPPQLRDGATGETRPARAGCTRDRIGPKSFLYHFAVKAL